MLELVLAATDDFDEATIQFEHSLVSLSKWESFYEKPFYGKEEKNLEEMVTYMNMMIISSNPPSNWLERLNRESQDAISDYINSQQSATWFNEDANQRPSREIVTAELIYYWLIVYKIPFTCETWHINRLMTLIRVCSVKQEKPKKMSDQARAEQMRRLNEQRRQELGTTG